MAHTHKQGHALGCKDAQKGNDPRFWQTFGNVPSVWFQEPWEAHGREVGAADLEYARGYIEGFAETSQRIQAALEDE